MKKTLKITMAIVMTFVMMIAVSACGGLDMKKISGEWTMTSMDGMTPEEYAAAYGVDVVMARSNMTVASDKVTIANANGSTEFKITVKANGFEVLKPADNSVYMSVTYDASADTLSYKVSDGTNEHTLIYGRGTSDLTVAAADDAAADGDAAADEEVVDDGAIDEEEYSEDGAEEDGAEEEYTEE